MRNVLLAAVALAVAVPMSAQTVVTPTSLNGWVLDDGKGNGDPSRITTAQPYLGNGSLQLGITAGNQQPDAYYYLSSVVSLATVRSSSINDFTLGMSFLAPSTEVAAPTLRLLLAGIGNTGGSSFGSFGWFGNTGPGWQTASLNSDVGDFFLRVAGSGASSGQLNNSCGNTSYSGNFGSDQRQTIDNWLALCGGGTEVDLTKAVIYGVEVDYGSFPGFTGNTNVFVDDVSFNMPGTNGNPQAGEFNFETDRPITSTPEPTTLSLLAASLLGLGVVVRRKRRA